MSWSAGHVLETASFVGVFPSVEAKGIEIITCHRRARQGSSSAEGLGLQTSSVRLRPSVDIFAVNRVECWLEEDQEVQNVPEDS